MDDQFKTTALYHLSQINSIDKEWSVKQSTMLTGKMNDNEQFLIVMEGQLSMNNTGTGDVKADDGNGVVNEENVKAGDGNGVVNEKNVKVGDGNGTVVCSGNVKASTNNITSHTNNDTSHTNNDTSHTNNITSHTNNDTSHTNNITSHTNNITANTNNDTSHTNNITANTNNITANTNNITADTNTQVKQVFKNKIINHLKSYTLVTKNPPYFSYHSGDKYFILITPCTEHHIAKYSPVSYKRETYDQYQKYLKESKLSCEWIKQIINGEKEEIIAQNEISVIIPSYKWNKKDISDLYLLAFFKDDQIFTLRELKQQQLENVKNFIFKTVKEKYGILSDQIMLFFHYRPSYYHCHVHITNIAKLHLGMVVGRGVLLDDVLENLKLDSEYYKKRDMFYIG
ncbi:hypothetical protein M153_100046389 [Pseudoloma neurophilia]|uniref:Scavenger mRNA decapping enzyme n=1 Tax=Pseudoloma neurophilia TaxID=146866 RepID=A0A0R0M727_9MICR|nr:hypothetical protein M153_100046389 [Pseudoloma neurophilia]